MSFPEVPFVLVRNEEPTRRFCVYLVEAGDKTTRLNDRINEYGMYNLSSALRLAVDTAEANPRNKLRIVLDPSIHEELKVLFGEEWQELLKIAS